MLYFPLSLLIQFCLAIIIGGVTGTRTLLALSSDLVRIWPAWSITPKKTTEQLELAIPPRHVASSVSCIAVWIIAPWYLQEYQLYPNARLLFAVVTQCPIGLLLSVVVYIYICIDSLFWLSLWLCLEFLLGFCLGLTAAPYFGVTWLCLSLSLIFNDLLPLALFVTFLALIVDIQPLVTNI